MECMQHLLTLNVFKIFFIMKLIIFNIKYKRKYIVVIG